jgi:HK97 family phage major capsid protein
MDEATTEPPIGVLAEMQAREKRTYSIFRAIVAAKSNASGAHTPDGFEGEVSAEIARRSGRSPRGWFLPHSAPIPERRANDTTTTGAGAAQTIWPGQFVDVLRSKLVVAALGGRITALSAEKGQVKLPVQTQQHAAAWVSEGSAAGANTALAVSSVTFVPHTILVNTGVSRFMSDLYAPGFMDWLYDDLGKSIAVSVDQAAIAGQSGNNQPVGLLYAGLPTYALAADSGNGGAPSYADAVGMELAAALANADSEADAAMGWLTSPAGRSKLRRTDSSNLDSGTSGQWVWDKNRNSILGYPALATTNVPSNLAKGTGTNLSPLVYGNWRDLVVNLFDAVDVVFNPFAVTSSGFYGLYAYQEVDVQIRRSAAFQVVNAMVTS